MFKHFFFNFIFNSERIVDKKIILFLRSILIALEHNSLQHYEFLQGRFFVCICEYQLVCQQLLSMVQYIQPVVTFHDLSEMDNFFQLYQHFRGPVKI